MELLLEFSSLWWKKYVLSYIDDVYRKTVTIYDLKDKRLCKENMIHIKYMFYLFYDSKVKFYEAWIIKQNVDGWSKY